MAIQAGGTAPYTPPKTLIEVLSRLRERGLTTPITTEVLERAGVAETLSQRTLQSLRLLDFVDANGNLNDSFEALSRAPEKEYREGLAELITAAYSEVWSFADPAKDSIERVRDAFRPFNPRGQQERMVALFLGLCEYAGMDVSAATASKRKAGESHGAQPRSTPRQSARAATNGKAKVKDRSKRAADDSASRDQATDNASDLPPGLVGLLRQIPRNGAGWPQPRRDEFLTAFSAVLDFSVPVRDTEPAPTAPSGEGDDPS